HYHHVRPWQRIAIYVAGPGAGLVLAAVVLLFQHFALWKIDPTGGMPSLHEAVRMLLFMNLMWSVLNLVPVFPLDGGQISREVCPLLSRRNGFRLSLGLSFLVAGVIAVYAVMVMSRPRGELWFPRFGNRELVPGFMAILFGLLAVQSFVTMRSVER